jgi:DNA (cytosine-5)-methyltransferase 1
MHGSDARLAAAHVAHGQVVLGAGDMTRGATLFSGGGGVEALLKQRINFVHAVEYDPAIAAVYRANHGDHVQVASVCDVDYSLWGQLDYLHASPVCKEFSQAKTGGIEGDTDIQTALAVVRCIEQTTPRVFTLENVGGYQRSKSYALICRALDLAGYMWHAEVLNSADFGVPQTRRRLILRAVKDALLPGLAAPEKWVGWYVAIEDLLSGLPVSQFAPWQLARLPEWLGETALVEGTEMRGEISPVFAAHPSCTIKATTYKGMPRAFIMRSANTQQQWGDGVPHAVAPMYTVTSDSPPKAWLVAPSGMNGDLLTAEHEPSHTITSGHLAGKHRAWLSQGRVVKMNARTLARFQSLPDAYVLPDKSSLACTVIGNMVPSLMMQKIVEPLL